MTLPQLFEDRMKNLLGSQYEDYLQCYHEPHFGGIRVNALKLTPKEFEQICPFPMEPVPWVSNGYYYDTNLQPARHPYYYAGLYYIQEPSAMTPASLLPVEPGDKVLDLCAAPGGKSTELGAKLGGEGILVSNDISNSRAKALLKNIEMFGISNSLVLSEDPEKLVTYFPEYFDKILIDAPCSGEGMFRKSASMIKNWEELGVDHYSALQKEIIRLGAKMLKPGGMMLYSTCTFAPEENEETIADLLEQCPEFQVVNAIPSQEKQKEMGISYEGFDCGRPEWSNGKEELKHCIRLWPHKIKGEGHFIALLTKAKRDGGESMTFEAEDKGSRKQPKLSPEAKEFLEQLELPYDDHQLVVRDERVYLLPKGLPELKGLRILRHGLLLGEMKKQRFEPHQALANALKKENYNQMINFAKEDPNVIKYLKGETIELMDQYNDGWNLVCVDGFPLGWAKLNKGNFKNKYFPGWRWM